MFTGVLQNNYSPPDGFCFDIFCDDPEIVVSTENTSFDVKSFKKMSNLLFLTCIIVIADLDNNSFDIKSITVEEPSENSHRDMLKKYQKKKNLKQKI